MSERALPVDDPRFASRVALEELRAHSLASGAATVAGQSLGFLIRIAATLVLARVLTPADYGVVAVAVAATAFFALFRDLGLRQAAVQGASLSHEQVSTLFWINTANGLALGLLNAAVAPLLGRVFGDPRVAQAALGLSLTHVFVGLAAQHQAVLGRQMRLKTLAALEAFAVLLGVIAAIVAARAGAGFWALVLMPNGIALASAACALLLGGLRPGPPLRGTGLRPLFTFGGHVTFFGITSYLSRNADNLLIGRCFGAHQLGLYDKAYQLMMVPGQAVASPLSSVALPVLSRLQADPARFREYYRLFVLASAGLTMPLTAFLFVTADRILPLLVGPQWIPSVPLFRALAPGIFTDAVTLTASWIFMALGQTRRQLGFSAVSTLCTLLAFVAALPFGPLGVALAVTACRLAVPVPTFLYTCQDTPVSWREPFAVAFWPAASALLAAVALHGLEQRWVFPASLLGMLGEALVYGLTYALLLGAAWPWWRAE